MSDAQPLINHYAREGYARSIKRVCEDVLAKRPDDAVAAFWSAYGTIREGAYNEALRELQALDGRREVELSTLAAMAYAHRLCKMVDHEAVDDLEDRLRAEEGSAAERTLLQLATLYWLLGGVDVMRAKTLVERVLAVQPSYPEAQTLQGWIELTEEDDGIDPQARVLRAEQIFDDVMQANPNKELEAIMGKVKVLELKGELAPAVELLNVVIVQFPWFTSALCEKARLHMIQGDWEQLLETAHRVLSAEPQNIQALRLTTLYLLSREGRQQVACKRIAELQGALEANEPRNALLYYNVARPTARLAGGNREILQKTLELIKAALKIAPDTVEYLNEYAYQLQVLGEYPEAIQTYRRAAAIDEADGTLDDLSSMYGTIGCQIADGQLDEAAQQLDFLNDIATEPTPKLAYLTALLTFRQSADVQAASRSLDQAVDLHLKSMRGKPFSYDYFVDLDPDLLLECARLYLAMSPGEPRQATEPLTPQVQRASRVLELLVRKTPGVLEAQVLLARSRFLAGDMDGAARAAGGCLRLDPAQPKLHILLAQVHLAGRNFKAADNALEQAVSFSFDVRESPVYAIARGHVLLKQNQAAEALKVLEAAMQQPGVRRRAPQGMKVKYAVTLNERASVFLLLAEAHSKLNQMPEATKMIQDALNEFLGTPEEVRVNIANCELSLSRGDTKTALRQLNAIPSSSPHYVRAKMALADIHLNHRNDREGYRKCYEELVEHHPDVQTYCMYGDALMAIQEPELAVGAFEQALAQNPKDTSLASKIGRALVITHDYQKAVDYYEKAVRADPSSVGLQQELAKLYLKLKRFDLAERTLNVTLRQSERQEDFETLTQDVVSLRLLAKVHLGMNDNKKYGETLLRTKQLQVSLLSRSRGDPDEHNQQKMATADLCFQIAEDHMTARRLDEAMGFYNEALKHDEANKKSIFALARLHLMRGETDACQQQCVTLLRIDPDNEEATMMLAELMFHKEHYETAIYHFQQLLERKPQHYLALSHLVKLLRHAGRLSEVPRYLRMAEKVNLRATHDPGLHYCRGLHAKFSNNMHDALRYFNLARKDSEWGTPSLYAMVEIYLNPENENLWEDAPEGRQTDNTDGIRAASQLLSEVRGRRGAKHTVLEAYTLMASKQKADVDEALSKVLEICNDDHDNVPALLAMATAFMMMKQTPKARNQLKRISKMSYNVSEADEFERSWLMLVDIHVQGGKYDLAQELCRKCLKYNKSCSKAWEYLGQIMEREQSYRDAAEHYENAWKFEAEASPTIGFRLAFNYLKARRFVDAIDVCHKVLAIQSGYPKIRSDILSKARQALRS